MIGALFYHLVRGLLRASGNRDPADMTRVGAKSFYQHLVATDPSSLRHHLSQATPEAENFQDSMLVTIPNGGVGIILCYDNPMFEEEEQEIPFIRWCRYLNEIDGERYVERMTLITISSMSPVVQHGSAHFKSTVSEESRLEFQDSSSGDIVPITLQESLNASIEKQFECQGQISTIPTWNGKEVVLGRLSILDHEKEVSGSVFAKEWIGVLCVSLFYVTKTFIGIICGETSNAQIEKDGSKTKLLKGPKPSSTLFWIWWPLLKPVDLGVFLREMGSKKQIDMSHLRNNPPTFSGIYRATICQVEENEEKSWVMRIHADREAVIPIFFEPEEKPNMQQKESGYKSNEDDTRVIFNRNFAMKHGTKETFHMYGIFGSMAYVAAQLLPYTKDNLCPMLPCLSPWGSLHAFKEAVKQREQIPGQIGDIVSRSSRLCTLLKEVLEDIGHQDMDYFEM